MPPAPAGSLVKTAPLLAQRARLRCPGPAWALWSMRPCEDDDGGWRSHDDNDGHFFSSSQCRVTRLLMTIYFGGGSVGAQLRPLRWWSRSTLSWRRVKTKLYICLERTLLHLGTRVTAEVLRKSRFRPSRPTALSCVRRRRRNKRPRS